MPPTNERSLAAGVAPQRPSAGESNSHQADLDSVLPKLRQRLLRHARFALNDPNLAEDLVQDTLIAVVVQHDQRRRESSLTTWATAILKHKVADWYRSPLRQRAVQWTADNESDSSTTDRTYGPDGGHLIAGPTYQQPESREEQRQMMSALKCCVSSLPRQTGRVFMMREWLGFDNAEICSRLSLNADHCRTILHRARIALRTCMVQY